MTTKKKMNEFIESSNTSSVATKPIAALGKSIKLSDIWDASQTLENHPTYFKPFLLKMAESIGPQQGGINALIQKTVDQLVATADAMIKLVPTYCAPIQSERNIYGEIAGRTRSLYIYKLFWKNYFQYPAVFIFVISPLSCLTFIF